MYKEKIISIKIDQKLWKEVKLLALMPDKSIKALLEELLRRKLKVKMVNESLSISQNVLQTLDELRKKVKTPFIITTQKTAVELVCEGKGICSRTG
ncbi:MAG: hypothetical protein ACP5OK_05015, partial [Thermoprotei archaeon]